MAASPAASSRRSRGSSSGSLRRSHDDRPSSPSMPVDTLVNHLLAAKRSLSAMTLVLRANELVNAARHSHEETAILRAQAGFLRSSILDQAMILVRVRRTLQATYDWGKKDFKKLVKGMDEADAELGGTMDMLRNTEVQSVLRPKGEEPKSLLDFVDEASVHEMRNAMKKSIEDLQGIQQSFDGDLLRFDTDIRNLKKIIAESPLPPSRDETESADPTTAELVYNLVDHSSNAAQLLASLTKHFDMCVTAIRTTDGAAALARRKAAEVTQSQGGESVSISGVIAEQESNTSDLEPKTAEDRAEMFKVVVQDAKEVDDVVQEIHELLGAMERDNSILGERTAQTQKAYIGMLAGYAMLGELGDRLGDYLAAEEDFRGRWELEKDSVFGKLREMHDLRVFYEGYASAYDSLILEVERRRGVDERVQGIWRKAQENVDKLLDADGAARETFRQDVGEYLPTDLFAGMKTSARRWRVVPVVAESGGGDTDDSLSDAGVDAAALRRSAGEAARRMALREGGASPSSPQA